MMVKIDLIVDFLMGICIFLLNCYKDAKVDMETFGRLRNGWVAVKGLYMYQQPK